MIIFGLGNPGLKYRSTRHNAGYIFLEQIARRHRKRFSSKKYYEACIVNVEDTNLRLVKPKCWMNQCGYAIQDILEEFKCAFLVVVDDINLPLGRMRLRSKGSDGGHLGLRSIAFALHTENFPRLRIGIGQPQMDAADYVLDRFSTAERKTLSGVLNEASQGIHIMLRDGFVRAQDYINSINIKDID
jgi:PTH1 family peptidyl-tRNA hydrolase